MVSVIKIGENTTYNAVADPGRGPGDPGPHIIFSEKALCKNRYITNLETPLKPTISFPCFQKGVFSVKNPHFSVTLFKVSSPLKDQNTKYILNINFPIH